SKTYYIAKREGIPFHQQVELQLMEWTAQTSLMDKLLLVGMNANNRRKVFKTQVQGNRVIAQIHEPAEVYLTVDTIAPKIELLNYNKATSSFPKHKIEVKITDDLSGIQSYDGYINDQWVLFDYDAKVNLLTHTFDQDWKGENTLRMSVKDVKNNVAELNVKF